MAKNELRSLLNKSFLLNIVLAVAVVVLAGLYVYQFVLHPVVATQTTNSTTNSSDTLAGVNQPLNASELAVINDAPLSYYEFAGQKLLNGSLTNEVIVSNAPQYNAVVINGKPSVIYIGATSCIFCGENRWAMALALGKLGNFTSLYNGYSSFGDGDLPTLYWKVDNITTTSGVAYGNYYTSKYINFYSSDYESPITGGFQIQPLSYFIQHAPNATYSSVLTFMNSTGKFAGTPFTMWGNAIVTGADAVILGNTSTQVGGKFPIALMTHGQIINQLSAFKSQFAWSEFAAADVYLAYVCPSISNSAPACQLPAIKQLELAMAPAA